MERNKDYRNTEYCPCLKKVVEQKEILEKEIQLSHPHIKIIYNKVKKRNSIYHQKFYEIYNKKCAYCGAMLGLLPLESFEVDHFINEASFPHTTEGRSEAGRMNNLVWACISCNRGKSGITIEPPYDDLLNVDNGNIAKIFKRDESFNIKISDAYQDDKFIQRFYNNLHLGYERRRLDYLAVQLQGMYQSEKDEIQKSKLGEMLFRLLKDRNQSSFYR